MCSSMAEEETLENNSKSPICAKSEEFLPMIENPVINSMDVENPSPDFAKSDDFVGGSISETLDSAEVLAMEENPSKDSLDSCKTGDNIVAQVDKTLEIGGNLANVDSGDCCVVTDEGKTLGFGEIVGSVGIGNLGLDCCKSGEVVSGDEMIVEVGKIVEEVSEDKDLENPDVGGISGGFSEIDDAQVAKTLVETAELVKEMNEYAKYECLKLDGDQEECNKEKGVSFEDSLDDDDDDPGSGFSDDADYGENEMALVDVSGKSGDSGDGCGENGNGEIGCSSGEKEPLFGGSVSPFRQDFLRKSKQCDYGRCPGGEDDVERRFGLGMMGDPYAHPYFADHGFPYSGYPPHMNKYGFRRREMRDPEEEEEHEHRMWHDVEYRMYHVKEHRCRMRKNPAYKMRHERQHYHRMMTDKGYRMRYEMFRRAEGMDDEAEHFYGPGCFNGPRSKNRRGFMERESEWSLMPSRWSEPEPCPVGAGLSNLGNTCFLNAIMQCFTHTVPLVEGLHSLKHEASSHGQDEICVLCGVRDQIDESLRLSGKSTFPSNLVDNLNHISSFFRRYQQEDAHEFLQCLVDKLDTNWGQHESNAAGDVSSSGESLVKQVFGGRLVSQLRCCKCGHSSDSYEPVNDLSLEIEDVDDLESAFKSFMKVENLEDTADCESCKEKVHREKQLMLDQAPPVAALHLKRFKSDGKCVEKIDRMVKYPLELNLDPFTRGARDDNEGLKYELYGLVVHVGLSSTSGHYFCYIRTSPDAWYRFDDSKVTKVSEETALDQEAYILFYARKGTPWFSGLLEQWKAHIEEKSNTSPKSVLDSTNLPSTSIDVGVSLNGSKASDKEDAASVTYVEPLSIRRVDKVEEDGVTAQDAGASLRGCKASDKQDAVSVSYAEPMSCRGFDEVEGDATAAHESAITNINVVSSSSEPIYDELPEDKAEAEAEVLVSGGKAEVEVLVSAGAKSCSNEPATCLHYGEDVMVENHKNETGMTSLETCSVSNFENHSVGKPKYDVETDPAFSPTPGSLDISAGHKKPAAAEVTFRIPTAHLKKQGKAASSVKHTTGKAKEDPERKEAARYLTQSSMPSSRRKSLLAFVTPQLQSKKRRNHASLIHRPSPKKRVKISPKRSLRTVAASV